MANVALMANTKDLRLLTIIQDLLYFQPLEYTDKNRAKMERMEKKAFESIKNIFGQ